MHGAEVDDRAYHTAKNNRQLTGEKAVFDRRQIAANRELPVHSERMSSSRVN